MVKKVTETIQDKKVDEDASLDIPYPAGHNWEGLIPRQVSEGYKKMDNKKDVKMPFRGEHLMMALKVKNNLEDTKFLKSLLRQAVAESKATILDYVEHKFEPQGYSIVILIGESHASLHTYPEKNGVFIDFFTCGEIKTDIFKQFILNHLNVIKIIEDKTIIRGET